ncbi:hypothetical protein ACGF4C_16145 [Streptomyces sp. NPDC048197]|uniref:hypothetical protein n=1 Tax=Streptomyces sp. NPDC048197 TaxID=3365511 RepID=UPI00371A4D16
MTDMNHQLARPGRTPGRRCAPMHPVGPDAISPPGSLDPTSRPDLASPLEDLTSPLEDLASPPVPAPPPDPTPRPVSYDP